MATLNHPLHSFNPSGTEILKRDVMPRRISELPLRKKSIFTEPEDGASISREDVCSPALRAFDSRKPSHRKIDNDEVSSLITKLHVTLPNAIPFKSIPITTKKLDTHHFK